MGACDLLASLVQRLPRRRTGSRGRDRGNRERAVETEP